MKLFEEEYLHEERTKPIILNSNTIASMRIFTSSDSLERVALDIGLNDCLDEESIKKRFEYYKESAKEFIKQLDEHWTPAFMEALRDEINTCLKKHNEMITKFKDENSL